MSGENWTTGPWQWGKDWTSGKTDKYMDFRLLGPKGEEIIPIRVDHHEPIWDSDPLDSWAGMTSDADRILIAAAPDLYEALAEAAEFFDDRADAETLPDQGDVGNEEMRLLGVCQKALAKARGEDT